MCGVILSPLADGIHAKGEFIRLTLGKYFRLTLH